ncbi:MAG TPA: peptide chain release factor 2, partial [Candidatus Eisenbacteria bacterium]|nr:peptide chain release factor 2 [Candidatus Eisenbacteria bacterium]
METAQELKRRLDRVGETLEQLRAIFEIASRRSDIAKLEAKMAEPGFWDRPAETKEVIAQLKTAKRVVGAFDAPALQHRDLLELIEMADGDAPTLTEIAGETQALERKVADLELESLLSGENDGLGAVLQIHPGAGGTESQDWAQMLLRMYMRWCERRGYAYTVLDLQPGDEAGIKDASLEVQGDYAYGFLRSESGVHRLVRISPYDAAQRRHTSFASVTVFPAVDETIEVNIDDKDLRVDTFRSSGAGGQHVNKTESAVRITHLPTGIAVSSQAERSQHRNRELAMRILKARLYAHLQEIEKARLAGITGPKKDIDFGSQIRSYVLHPYTMVKDHRTGAETSDTTRVLDGDVDLFI